MLARIAPIALALAAAAPAAPAAEPKRLAILYFDNDTKDPDLDLLRKGMADMLITDLSDVEGVTVVEREKLEALLSELKLQRSRYFDPKTAVKLGRGAGASHAVTGAFNAVGEQLRIDVRLVDIGTGHVTATEKVLGKKADLFDLEQRLAAAFACRLTKARCQAPPTSRGGPDLDTVRRYAKGLDLADRGDLKAASRALQSVVTSAPKFAPAKATYRRIMKRLYAARETRTDQLSGTRKALEDHARAALKAGGAPSRQVGYRILAGQLLLHDIDAYFRALATKGAAVDDARFGELVQAYLQNQERLLSELDALAKAGDLPDPEISEADTKLGTELGLGDEPGVLSFYSTIQIRRDLGLLLTTGAAPFWGTFRWSKDIDLYTKHRIDSGVRVRGVIEYRDVRRPPVERLHDRFTKAALQSFDAALSAAEGLDDPETKQKQVIDTLDAYARGLVALGRPEEALARWQAILDRYPKYESYDEIEAKIRAALAD